MGSFAFHIFRLCSGINSRHNAAPSLARGPEVAVGNFAPALPLARLDVHCEIPVGFPGGSRIVLVIANGARLRTHKTRPRPSYKCWAMLPFWHPPLWATSCSLPQPTGPRYGVLGVG